MKVAHINHSDSHGGAARAAYRIHRALRQSGVDSVMWVAHPALDDWTVEGPTDRWQKLRAHLTFPLSALLNRLPAGSVPNSHSVNVIPSRWAEKSNTSPVDIVHLHWLGSDTASVADLGRIRKPIVWTLHDMWAFCGAEHYPTHRRWLEGYSRPDGNKLWPVDFDAWTWKRKHRAWKKPMHIVTPSHWLADCVRQSALMGDWPVSVVPNGVDTEVWTPVNRAVARSILGLPGNCPILAFGAMGGGKDPRKGFDLLQNALTLLRGRIEGLHLIVFGQTTPRNPPDPGFPVYYTGYLHDELSLRVLYSAADALVIPSRQDNLPNTGVEAMACGIPLVAFDTGGLPDLVTHERTGYLAHPFEAEDLAKGIAWILDSATRMANLGAEARNQAIERFAYPRIAAQYRKIYAQLVDSR